MHEDSELFVLVDNDTCLMTTQTRIIVESQEETLAWLNPCATSFMQF